MPGTLPISINISETQTITFYKRFLTYNNTYIEYKDIQGISYLLTRTTHIHGFIPTHTSSNFKINIEANGQIYEAKSSALSFMVFKGKKEKNQEQIFGELVYVLNNLIKPFVIINLLARYAKEGELKIGKQLTINSNGLYKKRTILFWQDPEFLPWNQYKGASLHEGYLTIRSENPFFSCSMSTMNAVVMPDLLNFLSQRHGILDQETIKELEKINENGGTNITKTWQTSQPSQMKEKTMTEEIVSYENLSLQLLMELFKSAYFTVEPVDAHSFHVREGNLPIRVNIDEQSKRYIRFLAVLPLNKQKTHAQRVEYINRVNQQLIFIRAEVISPKDGNEFLMFDYYLWVEGGVTKRNIVSALKEFANVVGFAVSLDTEGVFDY